VHQDALAAAPFSPQLSGYRWELKGQSGSDADLITTGTLPAKHVDTSTLNGAVFGPSPQLDIAVSGDQLTTDTGADPGYPSSILVGPADPSKGIFDSPAGLDTYTPQAWRWPRGRRSTGARPGSR
jgi:hypothetical protein